MAAKTKTLDDLFLETLKDVYYAEKQAVRMLGKAAKAARSEELKAAFEQHREESQGQVERLDQVFELLGKPARSKTCEAIQGLNAEMAEVLEDFQDSPAADAALIGAAQAVEHYEIARYGTLKTWAGQLGMTDAVEAARGDAWPRRRRPTSSSPSSPRPASTRKRAKTMAR